MIDALVTLALRRRMVVAMICVFVAIYGYYSWTQLAIEAYPDIADTSSQVVTQAPGLAAEEVEQRITIPLERELNGTPGLLFMRSKSTFGLSLITLVFRDGIEDYWSRQRINERIQNVTLPAGVTPGLDPLTSPTGQIYYYTLESDSKGLRDLSEIQRWIIIPALKQIPGVADIQTFGGITTQFQLELDPQQLVRFNLSLANIEAAINANNTSAGGSVVARGDLGFVIRGIGLVQTLDDLGAIVVTQRNGTPILLRDLGKLKLANQERHGVLGKDRKNDAVEGTVLLLRGDNPSRVISGVHAKVAELNARLKSDDVQIVPYLDRADLVDATVDKISHTIFEGIGLVVIVLIVFLGSARSAVIIGITIPFAMLMAFILMNLLRIPANLLSLGAIDFGIIVDGAIVMTEAMLRRRGVRARQAAHRSRCRCGRPSGGAADLLRHTDNHHDLFPAVRVPAHRGQVVLPDGLCRRLCPVRRTAAGVDAGAGLVVSRLSQAAASFPQPRSDLAGRRLPKNAAPLAAAPLHRLRPDRRRRRRRGRARRDRLARIPARAR